MTDKEVINIMHEFAAMKFSYLSLKEGETKLVLKQGSMTKNAVHAADSECVETEITTPEITDPEVNQSINNALEIKAPLVGVYYHASSPEAVPFVEVGQSVAKGDTIALIEAMKMMNEVKVPCNGTVRKICVQNGEMVEFDRVLMEIARE